MIKVNRGLRLFGALASFAFATAAATTLFAPTGAHAAACAPAWSAGTIYTAGNTASENGINYVANWWTQGNDPATNNGGAGSGQPWTSQGACGGATCTTKPGAPTGLSASGTTQTSTTLTWTAVTAPANCSISSYTVYKAGVSLGTSTTATFAVTGLTASTNYTFTVAATDAAGTGVQSASVSVTTLANTCTAKPGAPTGVAASGTTSSSTTLNWSAVTAPSGCSISGYTVYQGGAAKATISSGTSYTVTGLSASTAYSFTVAAIDSAGASAQSNSVSVTTLAASGGLNPSLPPGKNFNLSGFTLQLPTGSSGNVDTESGSALAAGFTDKPYFYTDPNDGSMVMADPAVGWTTSGSLHPRVEMRENATWPTSGTNMEAATVVVTEVPDHTTVGQIFQGSGPSKPLCELQVKSSGAVQLLLENTNQGGNATDHPVGTVSIGSKFTYSLQLQGTTVTVKVNGTTTTFTMDPSFDGENFYFKAGDYDQTAVSGTPSTTVSTIVKFYALTITH